MTAGKGDQWTNSLSSRVEEEVRVAMMTGGRSILAENLLCEKCAENLHSETPGRDQRIGEKDMNGPGENLSFVFFTSLT